MRPLTARCGCQTEKSGGATRLGYAHFGAIGTSERARSRHPRRNNVTPEEDYRTRSEAECPIARTRVFVMRESVISRKRPGGGSRRKPTAWAFPSAVVEYRLPRARTRDGRTLGGRPEAPTDSRSCHSGTNRQRSLARQNKTTKYKHSRGWNGRGSVEFTLLNCHQNSSGLLYLRGVDTVTTGVSTYLSTPVSHTQLTEQSEMFRCASTSIDDRPKHCGSSHAVARDRACRPARA